MGIADFLDTALSALPGYKEAALWPYQQQIARSQAEGAPLVNERARLGNERISIGNLLSQSALDDYARERADRASAAGATGRVLSAYQAQPQTVTSETTGPPPADEMGDLGNQPSITTATPGRETARTVPELLQRGVSPEDYRLAEQYNRPTMASLGLMTPEVAAQRDVEQQGRAEKLAGAQRATGLQAQLDALDPTAPDYRAQVIGVLTRMSGPAHPGDVLKEMRRGDPGAEMPPPKTMELAGVRWESVFNPETGSYSPWHRAPAVPEHESAIQDWIASHPKETAGLSPEQARDKARAGLDERKTGERYALTHPGLTEDAVDRAADYLHMTGSMPVGVAGRNPRLQTQIMDREAQNVLAGRYGTGEQGLAAQKASYKANEAELVKLQSQRGPVMAFMETAEKHLARADELSKGVPRTEIPVLNKWLLSGQTNWTGNPQTAALAAQTRLATAEVAKVVSSANGSGGVISDSVRKELEDTLRPAMATGQFSEVVKTLRGMMQDRAVGYDSRIAATQARMQRLSAAGGGAPPAAPAADRIRVRSKADPSRLGWIGAGEPIPPDVEVVR